MQLQAHRANVMLTGDRTWRAGGEGVSLEAFRTVAHGHMVVDAAQCRRCADALARVDALVVLARLIAWALGVRDALRLALHVRIAEVASQAFANGNAIFFRAACVVGAHARIADCLRWRRQRWKGYDKTTLL